jgi:hypothetical protein
MKKILALVAVFSGAAWTQVTVNPATLPDVLAGDAYNQTLTATGGTAPYTFSLATGTLPPGITIGSAGVLSGTSFSPGSYTFTIQAVDSTASAPQSGTRTYSIRVITFSCPDPAARIGDAYSDFVFTNPTAANYAITAGTLPPGLSFNTTSGSLTGTPTAIGTYNFTLQANYISPTSSFSSSCNIYVAPRFESFAPRVTGRLGVPYRSSVSIFSHIPAASFSLASGSLPPGLSLESSTGIVSGIPTAAGTYSAQVNIADSAGSVVTGSTFIRILARAESPVELRCPMPVGVGNQAYLSALSVNASVSSFAISSGSLPAGLSLNPLNGVISGVGGIASGGTFTAGANLSGGGSISGLCSINFSEGSITGPAAFCPDQKDLYVGESYLSPLPIFGNRKPFATQLYQTSLPPGLTLSTTGVISGTPTAAGNFSFYYLAQNNSGSSTLSPLCTLNVTLAPPLSITTTNIPNGQIGVPYSTQIQTLGGVPPISFAASSGLPPGITLSSSGLLSGSPTLASNFSFNIVALDSAGQSASRSLSISVFAPDPLRFNSLSLASGTVAIPYSQSFDIAGGAPPYSLQITNGTLPPGLRLSGTGLSGTPTVSSSWPFTLQVTDSAGSTITGDFTLNVAQGSFRIGCPAFSAEVGVPYSSNAVVFGGTAPFQFSLSAGSLPAGLELNTATGEISGRSNSAGSSTFTLSVTDAAAATTASRCAIGVVGGPLRIITSGPIITMAGKSYAGTIETVGGRAPYRLGVLGNPAPGLNLAENGTLGGTALRIGDFNVVVEARDAAGQSAQRAILIRNTASDLRFGCPLPAEVNAGRPIASQIQISAGLGPYTLALASGVLPAGVTFGAPDSAGAVSLSGTPTATGDFVLNLRAGDSTGTFVTQSCTLKVTGALLTLATDVLPNGRTGANYASAIVAAGGVTPLLYGIGGGSLPPGIGIDPSTGQLSGTALSAGTYTANFTVQDRIGQSASRDLPIVVEDGALGLTITTPAPLSDGLVGRPYSQSFNATGGVPPYNFTFAGELPPGLSFENGISGTPTALGSGNATVTVRDSAGTSSERTYAVRVVADPALNITTETLPDGVLNENYAASVAAAGGTPPYRWTILNGRLPNGVSFDSNQGRLVGTATSNGQFDALILVEDSLGDISRRAYRFEVRPAGVERLEITTASLAAASVGIAYTAALAARGGQEPYRWEVRGILPQGMSLSGSQIQGTGPRVETTRFLVVVTDSLGLSASRELSLAVSATTAPAISFTGLGDTLGANANAPFGVTVTRPLAVATNVRLTLRFTPDTIHNTDDAAVRFGNGARTLDFVLPAQATSVTLPSGAAVQTGTLAGTITISAEFNVGGTTLPGPSQAITIRRAVPVITAVRLTRASGNLEVRVEGFTNTRQLAEARVTFTFANNVDVTSSSTATVNVASAIQAWFANAASIPFGGQFGLTLPFSVTGDPANITSVSVVVTNGEGASSAVSAQ